MKKRQLLVIDDDNEVRRTLQITLEKSGYEVICASNGTEGLQLITKDYPDVVLTDVALRGFNGLEVLEQAQTIQPGLPIIMMTRNSSIREVVHAMKAGAFDYLSKPIEHQTLLAIIQRSLREKKLNEEVAQLRAEVDKKYGFENIIGSTPAIQACFELVEAVADSTALVLITGPTGTGKELLARAIHYRSPRRHAPFIVLNCAALPQSLLASELFGHEKGSFTGAVRQHRGRFEQANGGSLLLDEIGEIDIQTQVKLLRVLQSGEFQRIGGNQQIKVDTRVIAATNKDLRAMVAEGRFRKDLYYRLNVFQIPVPPLIDRKADIPLLIDHFIRKYAAKHNRPAQTISSEAMEHLLTHEWPGNIRELEHIIERSVILSTAHSITAKELPSELKLEDTSKILPLRGQKLPDVLREVERTLIINALKDNAGIQARAAKKLGISRSNLNYRMQKLHIQSQKYKT